MSKKGITISGEDALLYAGAAALAVGVLYFAVRKVPAAAVSGVADAVTVAGRATGIIAAPGSVYENRGPIGSAANVANNLSGGLLERAGRWLGQRVADLRGL